MNSLLQDVAACRDLTEDYHLSLRRRPGYFVQDLNGMDDHRKEHLQVYEWLVARSLLMYVRTNFARSTGMTSW
jgi:hypothetical protein